MAEVLIEPIGEDFEVAVEVWPAVGLAWAHDKFHIDPGLAAPLDELFGLVDGNERIGISMHDEGGRGVGGDEVDGGDLAAQGGSLLGIEAGRTEGGSEVLKGADAHRVVAWFAPVEVIGWGKEAGDGLDGAALAVNEVAGFGVTGAALDAEFEGEVSAGAGAENAEFIGMGSERGRVMADPADGAVDVLLDFRDLEFGLGAMDGGHDGVAPLEEGVVVFGVDGFARGEEAAADDEDQGAAVGFGGLEQVEGEGGAELVAVDDVLGAADGWGVGRERVGLGGEGWAEGNQEAEGEDLSGAWDREGEEGARDGGVHGDD